MTSQSWFDSEKVSNALLKALQLPQHQQILESITYRKGVLLVPLNATLASFDITTNFILTHIVLNNSPPYDKEFVTLNGVLGLLTPSQSNNLYTMLISPAQVQLGNTDKQSYFDSMRSLLDQFKKDKKARQSVQVLKDGEVLIKKHIIKVLILDAPLEYEGCQWGKPQTSPSPSNDPAGKSFLSNLLGRVSKSTATSPASPSPSPANGKSTNSSTRSPSITSTSGVDKNQKEQFWAKIKQASDLSAILKNFVTTFKKRPPVPEEQSKMIKGFVEDMTFTIAQHKMWAGSSPDEMDFAQECVEKYIMTTLFNCCFAPAVDDIERDKYLFKRLQQLQFILPEHLDIAQHHRLEEKFGQAIEELRRINTFKAPRDKMVCILNSCRMIYSILNRASKEGHPAGADEFLPLLIYILLKANPPQLHSNMQYVLRFRASNKMITEAGYYFTHLESAVEFLDKLDGTKLSIDAGEFERLLTAAQKSATKSAESAAQHAKNLISAEMAASAGPSTPTVNVSSANTSSLLLDFDSATDYLNTSQNRPPEAESAPLISWSGEKTMAISQSAIPSLNGHDLLTVPASSRSSRSSVSYNDEEEPALAMDDSTVKFLTCNAEDLRIRDVSTLLEAYKLLYHENKRLQAELLGSGSRRDTKLL